MATCYGCAKARRKEIADGLAAAERGQHEQELAEKRATKHIKEAKGQAADIIAQAQKRAGEIVEEAKGRCQNRSGTDCYWCKC